jgi:hypothetical protein
VKLQEKMLQTSGDDQLAHNNTSEELQYQRYLDVALIKFMEDELDVEKRTTRAKLASMKEMDFDTYLKNIKSAHRDAWIADQQDEKPSKPQLRADLALF